MNFNADGLQTSVVDRNGNATTYAYNTESRLTSITDPADLVTTLVYTGGRLSSITDPASRVTAFEHDADGNLIKITDPDGTARQFTYDNRHLMVTQVSKRGFSTTYEYNFAGRTTKANRPDGSSVSLVPAQTIALVDTSSGQGGQNNPAPNVRPEDVLASFVDGRGNSIVFELDEFGTALGSEDALGRTRTNERNQDRKITRSVRPDGRIDEVTYDSRGNLLKMREATGTPVQRESRFEYEAEFNQITLVVDPRQNETRFEYDTSGNLTAMVDAALTRTETEYGDLNCAGRPTRITQAAALPEESMTSFSYDPLTCNLIAATDPLSNTTSVDYDVAGNAVQVVDAELRISRLLYDQMNRVVKSIDLSNTNADPACGTDGVTCFVYDAAGNLAELIDANGNASQFEYDERDRLTSRTDPLLSSEEFEYDGNGNMRFRTDRKGQVAEFRYDPVNRVVSKVLQPGTPEEFARSFSYDLVDNVTSIVDPSSNLAFVYDMLDRVKEASTDGSPFQPAASLLTTYDSSDNRRTLVDPTGESRYVYDSLNRLEELTSSSLQTFSFGYDSLSRHKSTTRPNGVDTTQVYDVVGRLLDISHRVGTNTVSSFAYDHDKVGNRISLAQTRSSVVVTPSLVYDYDERDQVRQATRPQGGPDETFEYDSVGNRLLRDGQTFSAVFDLANRLVEDGEFCYSYDQNGNLENKIAKIAGNCSGPITEYTWDLEDRLVRIDQPGGGFVVHRYDGLNRRIEVNANGSIIRYIYDGQDILLEYNATNVLLARYTHGLGVDDPAMLERDLDGSGAFSANERFFYHVDGLGSVMELTADDGSVTSSTVYDTYGRIVDQTSSVASPYAFTGREFDAEIGLYYYRARYYDPEIGRFLSEDSFGFSAGDPNLYRYVQNNPVNFVDPDGRIPIQARGLGCALGAALGVGSGAKGALAKRLGQGFDESFLGGEGVDLIDELLDELMEQMDDLKGGDEGQSSSRSDGSGCEGSADSTSPSERRKELIKDVLIGAGKGAAVGCAVGFFKPLQTVKNTSQALRRALQPQIIGFVSGFVL
ncbi:MAG: hypothetical protein MJA83_09640 [Gammaproteobacteria bacterium]|nr:hypothetical protein [Gammaproteobacteria bacterium]